MPVNAKIVSLFRFKKIEVTASLELISIFIKEKPVKNDRR